MFKILKITQLKMLCATALVATGTMVGLSNASPANALTLTNNNGTPVPSGSTLGARITNFKVNEWVHLIYPTSSQPKDRIAGVMILQALSDASATFRIRIDNKFAFALDQFQFTIENLGNVNSSLADVAGISDTDVFAINSNSDAPTGQGSVNRLIPLSTPGSTLGAGQFDEFILTLTRQGQGGSNFASATGLSIRDLQFITAGGATITGNFSTIPTPALLPGLIAMGVGAIRRKRKQEAAAIEDEALDLEKV